MTGFTFYDMIYMDVASDTKNFLNNKQIFYGKYISVFGIVSRLFNHCFP